MFLAFFLFSCASQRKNESQELEFADGYFEKMRFVPVSEIVEGLELGELVDVKPKSYLNPCIIFVFKNDRYIFEILTNSENGDFVFPSKEQLANYIALGFFRIKNRKGEILKDFFHRGKKCKYSFLDEIPQYTSIEEIDDKIDIPLVKCDRGGFLFPFYNFIYSTGDGKNYLEIICTPGGDDKSRCFFTGGWTYLDEDDIRKMNENRGQ
ncbi:MAG: hypothetical protein IJ673_05550 [Treponema sp.]|nr:hypothetical protein [Treponema sp.]